ncbi:uncharacterized protein LOC142061207 isoform X1 [Phalacrocorax aristotelis]|uniref:uncharacterized protein LOC142061207 isoform X1 n=1 Tax=Phalacrocorax aristotelis TaxID=126867 RepID=UPI003F4C60D3
MEVRLPSSFPLLLLLAWLTVAGFAHQISPMVDVSVRLDLILQCLFQTGSNSTAEEVKWFNTTQNNEENQNKGDVEIQNGSGSAQLVFLSVNETHTGTYLCKMENRKSMSKNRQTECNSHGTASQPEESVVTVECEFKIWLENLTVPVNWYKPEDQEAGKKTNPKALKENSTNLTTPSVCAASTRIYGCRVFVTRKNLTDTGNSTQGAVPSSSPGKCQTKINKETGTGFNCLLCIIFGLAVGTLLYIPIIGLLLWQCRRNRKGEFTSRQMTEGNQLSMAAPVTGAEDLTYANLKFEKKGTNPASSDIIYTEIASSQQKQSCRDAGAANAGVDVSPEGEGK